jgi:3'-phosphoadenosine 5'-phosphosulfate sulfotransferase (PAPS reductase)/FAD synthetase
VKDSDNGDRPEWIELLQSAKTAFVLFSGGKDSCSALAYSKELIEKLEPKPSLIAIHVNTTVSLPSSEDFVEEFCNRLDIQLITLKPKTDYFTLAQKWGVPRPRARWCCYHLKIEPIKLYLKGMSDYIVLDGMRRDESRKRSAYPSTFNHPHFGLVIHPIIDWTQDKVEHYIESMKLPLNPAYEFGFSSWECWCGVFKRRSEFERLKEVDPEFFAKLVRLENSLTSGYAYAYFNGKPFYLRDLLDSEERETLLNGNTSPVQANNKKLVDKR